VVGYEFQKYQIRLKAIHIHTDTHNSSYLLKMIKKTDELIVSRHPIIIKEPASDVMSRMTSYCYRIAADHAKM